MNQLNSNVSGEQKNDSNTITDKTVNVSVAAAYLSNIGQVRERPSQG